jgi:hypothetical protein
VKGEESTVEMGCDLALNVWHLFFFFLFFASFFSGIFSLQTKACHPQCADGCIPKEGLYWGGLRVQMFRTTSILFQAQ